MSFTHLHLHSEYSLLDGACKIRSLVKRLKLLGQNACAITDHGAMYGAVEFYNACVSEGIKPIIGCECYICDDMKKKSSTDREYNHIILLCKNEIGYKNLCYLVSKSYIEGYYYKPRIDYKLLEKHTEGIIALSACLFGKLPQLLLKNQVDEAIEHALYMNKIFGDGNYYIEIMNHGLKDELTVLPKLINISKKLNIPMVATNDCHYLERKDALTQEVLVCIKTGKLLADKDRMRMETDELYVKSEEEMRSLLSECQEAVDNTQKIVELCNFNFDFKTKHLPHYDPPEGKDSFLYLKQLCFDGLKKLYNNANENSEPYKRLIYELDTINKMGYVDYFLIVRDFIFYAKNNNIPVGPGRGSGAGSIVAYTLGITGLDPLKYNLLFERFLNPERMSMPDLDIDFCYERRQEVIDYVINKYGSDRVSQIITFGTMAARAAIRDVGRALGIELSKVDKIAKAIPNMLGITIDKALDIDEQFKNMYESDEETKRLVDMAKLLEGMPRNSSTHAAGILISSRPIMEIVPLQKNDDVVTTQFTMTELESLGLLKMDFLGLRTLTVIRDTLSFINDNKIKSEEDIPLDDSNVYDMIAKADTLGVFQLESKGMRAFLHSMKPECFEDIIAAISLFRPGPMDSIPQYIQGKKNADSIKYLHEKLIPILNVTYGCIVYQEQVMQIVRELAGYSMGRSDLVRRAMSKKKHDVMEQERDYFVNGIKDSDGNYLVDGCIRRGIPSDIANKIFDNMISFASYAFNKSHAAAYGVLSVQTAYLKYYYPVEFMAAILNSFIDNSNKISSYINYCNSAGIKILPPDINRSYSKFAIELYEGKKCIRFALSAIKNVGINVVDDIVKERKNSEYKDLFDFISRFDKANLNKRMLESLIKSGAFDSSKYSRATMLQCYEAEMEKHSNKLRRNSPGQMSLFAMEDDYIEDTIKNNFEEFPKNILLKMEKEMTGLYISGHPLDSYDLKSKKYDIISDYIDAETEDSKTEKYDGKYVSFAGVISELRTRITKNGGKMASMLLEDKSSIIECVVFPKTYSKIYSSLSNDIVVDVRGRISAKEDEAIKLVVDNIQEINKEDRAIDSIKENVYVKIKFSDLEIVKSIIENYKGTSKVYAKLCDINKAIEFSEEYRVKICDELIDNLIEKFGLENIIIK